PIILSMIKATNSLKGEETRSSTKKRENRSISGTLILESSWACKSEMCESVPAQGCDMYTIFQNLTLNYSFMRSGNFKNLILLLCLFGNLNLPCFSQDKTQELYRLLDQYIE